MPKIGIADTTFARFDMFGVARKTIQDTGISAELERYTVPGVKDLPIAAKKLAAEYECDIVLALGMPGPEQIDKMCAHEASTGIIQAQLMTNKHILEVFVHADEADNERQLANIVEDRTKKHALNAIALLKGKETLSKNAGMGIRQGHANEGQLLS
ncbi:riboflavin synthase [Nanoarchaeota archaeon]